MGMVTTMTTISLAQVIAVRDNDYRPMVAEFTTRTGLGWHEPTPAPAAAGTSLSVVIPARNNGYSLPLVLDALARQDTSGTLEVIVVDDASTDQTPVIASHHPAVDVAYRLTGRAGAAAARTVGTRMAQADTIVYLDADMVLPPHVLTDIAARANPRLVLVGFRHNLAYPADPALLETEPDLEADHRVRWHAPAGVPMFYSGQVYPLGFVGRPLEDTGEFVGLGHGATYHDWDLPRMVVTALVAAPRATVCDVGGFDPGFNATGWGCEDTHLGAALIAAGCKVAPLRQVRGFHLDPPDAHVQWQTKLATAPHRIDHYRHLLAGPAPGGRAEQMARYAKRLLQDAQELR